MSTFTTTALITDALHLGSHWIYDQEQLSQAFPQGINDYSAPLSPYHPNRKAGENTHIGDQVRFLSTCIETNQGYSFAQWRKYWLKEMSSYDGYLDGATKVVLANDAHAPAKSSEFSVISRIAPILDLGLPLEETISMAQSQATLTHDSPFTTEAIHFFIEAIFSIKGGSSISEALNFAAKSTTYTHLSPVKTLNLVKSLDAQSYLTIGKELGLACSFEQAFPLTLFFAIHHTRTYQDCLNKNALTGGDNTARGIILSLLLHASGNLDLSPYSARKTAN